VLLCGLLLLPLQLAAGVDLDRLAGLTANIEQREGHFRQEKYLAAVDTSLKSSGSYSFLPGRSLRWTIEEPVSSELLVTADGAVSSRDQGQVAQLNSAENPVAAELGKILFAMLTADWQRLAEYFEIDGDLADTRWQVDLKPRNAVLASVFTHVELRGERLPSEILLHETGGNRTWIRLE